MINLKKIIAATLFAACAMPAFAGMFNTTGDTFVKANQTAVNMLVKNMKTPPAANKAFLVATLANVNDLTQSSTLGRFVSEIVRSELANHGFSVIEVKLRDSLYVNSAKGEFLLSRELQDLSKEQNAAFAVVGTYAVSGDYVFIDLKAVDVVTNNVLSGYSYSVDISDMESLSSGK